MSRKQDSRSATMASTITITCPECDRELKAPSDVVGKKIRCKGCGATFAARAPASASKEKSDRAGAGRPAARPATKPAAKPAPAKPAPAASDEEDGGSYGMRSEMLGARCPECASAMEDDDSIVCLHCGYNTMTRQKARTRKVVEQTGMDYFLWLLPGILCALFAIGLITFDVIYCIFARGWFGDEEWYAFLGGGALKLWLCIGSMFVVFFLGKYAFIRLILDNKPPEVEDKE